LRAIGRESIGFTVINYFTDSVVYALIFGVQHFLSIGQLSLISGVFDAYKKESFIKEEPGTNSFFEFFFFLWRKGT